MEIGAVSHLSIDFIFAASTAITDLSITLAALWQQVAMDQIKPTNEATNLAGTALALVAIAFSSFLIEAFIFPTLDRDTWKVNDDKSTIVPSVFMAWRGKKEHLWI